MQTIIDNLVKHQLIDIDNKTDVQLFLTRQEDTSKPAILSALAYVEMVKIVGRERISHDFDSIAPYLNMSLQQPVGQKQDSINTDLNHYLSKMNSAELITDSLYAECKRNIDNNSYTNKMLLIFDLIQRINYGEYLNADILKQQQKDYLTRQQMEDAILGWQETGILNHLTKEQIFSAKQKAFSTDYETLNDVLMNFPHVVHWFDTELENLNDPYAEFLKEFSNISHGVFNPKNISDNFNKPVKDKVTVQFSLNNKIYSKEFQVQDDWVDTDFFDFVKKAVNENKLAGQFYELYEGGQGGIMIFLTPKQHQYLKANKLVLFSEGE